jgi:hypothetical protein
MMLDWMCLVLEFAEERFSGRGHEEGSDDGKNEQRHAEGRGEKSHSWLSYRSNPSSSSTG